MVGHTKWRRATLLVPRTVHFTCRQENVAHLHTHNKYIQFIIMKEKAIIIFSPPVCDISITGRNI